MEKILNDLGFVDFKNYASDDGLKRKALIEIYQDKFITFQVLKKEKEWVLEKIQFENNGSDKMLTTLFGNPYNLDKVIEFIKEIRKG